MLFPHELDATQLRDRLQELGLSMVLFDAYPGTWAAGERGLLCLPGREEDFERSLSRALNLAALLGTRGVNVLAGVVPTGIKRQHAEQVAVRNLQLGSSMAQEAGISLMLEAINSTDMPGYLLPTVGHAARLVSTRASRAVLVQFDLYHVAMMGEDPIRVLREYASVVGHVQIADWPGRHQPGTGQLPVRAFLEELQRQRYQGSIGLEYQPVGGTDASLAWLPMRCRA